LPPGRYFRLLLIGYFEGLAAERAIAWRAADSFALREFLGLVLPEAPPDHSTISRTRRLIDLETHEAVFTWMLQRLADAGLVMRFPPRCRRLLNSSPRVRHPRL
jgi:transposase